MLRRRSTRSFAPVMSVIRRPTSARRIACWATCRRSMRAPASLSRCRGTTPATPQRRVRGRGYMESVERARGAPRWLTAILLAAGAAHAQPAPNDVTAELMARALAFEHGEGVVRDPQKAVEFYCVAARDGNAEAQYSLGWMYVNGRGVPHDEAIAATFFALAARSGHAYAERMLARIGDMRGELPD